ncbi:MAG TPA: AsmA family protein [Anaeromyxobacteraceae bacterium]|nr:AsmA family protein [Anaeromyxobacteraceae bacterium]
MTDTLAKPRRWPKVLAAVVVVLAVLGAAAAFALDRVLTSIAREQAASLSRQWERPVEIGAVKTTFLTGLGVRVEGVRIGAAAGEPKPLFELDRAEVKVALLRALTSGGKDVRVRSAELQGVRANVVKLKDGATNVDRLTEAMARNAPPAKAEPEKPKEPAAGPADLSGVRVEHAAVLDGRIAFVDEGAGGQELYVGDIDLVVDGLAAGAPLDVALRAGVLSAKQNVELKVHAPPLPASLTPSPDRVTLKVEPIDLTPLAPFAPKDAGFRGGRLSADLDVALGAAVPGGAGPTSVRGGFAATELRFAGQEGGKALDVTLDADLTADAKQGDLSIAKLLLTFGPAALEGRGKVTALLSEAPRIEGLRIVARNLDLAALAPYYPPLPKLLGGTMAGPIGLSAEAAGTADRAALELRADLTPVRMSFPKQLEKAAGGKLVLVARLRGGAAGALRFDADGDLAGVDLRPGGSLAKKPGDRLTFATAATRSVSGKAQRLELASFSLGIADTNVKAHGWTELAPRSTRFDLAVDVDRVDVDKLLLPTKAEAPAPKAAAKAKGDAASTYAGLAGKASLRIGEVIAEKQRLADVRVTVALKEDEVTVEEGRLGLWDGVFSVAGTQARLAPPDIPFKLVAKVEHAEVGALLAAFTDKKVLTGKLDADVRLSGRGEDTDHILKALDGTIEGKLRDGVFHAKDLVAEVTGPIVAAIPALKGKVTKGGTTKLRDVPVSLRIQGGKALLGKPIEAEERGATLTAQGTFSFDGELDMPTRLMLSPAAVSDLTGGKAKVDAPIPFSFKLVGKAWSPRLAGLDVMPAVKTIGAQLGAAALGKALGLKGTPQEAAKEKAAEVTGKAQEKVQEKAQDAAKALEQGAAKKLKGLFGR